MVWYYFFHNNQNQVFIIIMDILFYINKIKTCFEFILFYFFLILYMTDKFKC